MPRCEDYPCCGHEPGDCPNNDGTYNCATCGRRLPKRAQSSLCDRCVKRLEQSYRNHDIDHDHSLDY